MLACIPDDVLIFLLHSMIRVDAKSAIRLSAVCKLFLRMFRAMETPFLNIVKGFGLVVGMKRLPSLQLSALPHYAATPSSLSSLTAIGRKCKVCIPAEMFYDHIRDEITTKARALMCSYLFSCDGLDVATNEFILKHIGEPTRFSAVSTPQSGLSNPVHYTVLHVITQEDLRHSI